jgi:signal transduction histidine kinase
MTPNGSGLGLALVRLMLERAGGRVALEESPLGGARFIAVIPRVLSSTSSGQVIAAT